MRKIQLLLVAVACTLLVSCGNMNQVLSAIQNGSVINAITSVIGLDKVSAQNLIGSWTYSGPGCAFTSENLLAKAGGAVAAETCKEKLLPVYNTLGINSNNTQFQFTQDHQFAAKIKGIPLSGSYAFDPSSGTLKLQTMLFSSNAYITRTTSGLALTFESKNLLKVLQAVAAISGNSTLQTVGDLSKQFDGVRLGFEMAPAR